MDKGAADRCAHLATARRSHLGDGVHSRNYYVITEHLIAHPGSVTHTQQVEHRQRKAQQTTGTHALKPPSAGVFESEFAHVVGAIMANNGGIGAAVFDRHGLKVAAAGVQLESMVLVPSRRLAVAKLTADDPPISVRFACEDLRKLARTCDATTTRGVPCWDIHNAVSGCGTALAALYRPVLSHGEDDARVVGLSMIVVHDQGHCR